MNFKIKFIAKLAFTFFIFGCVSKAQEINKTEGKENNILGLDLTKDTDEKLTVFYSVRSRFIKTLVKEKLKGVKKLDDFIEYYPVNWIEKYDSVVLVAYEGNNKKSLASKNNNLSTSQISMLQSLDYSSRIEVNVFFKETNTINKKLESSHMERSFTIVTKYSAEYIKKEEALIDYLTKNSEDKINLTKVATIKVGPDSIVIPGPLNVLFVVNEQGITDNVRMERTSGDIETDELFQQLIRDMPQWKPARDS